MSNDLISIIVPLYNKDAYLKKCIQSLTQQTYRNIEILIIDDCSTDTSYPLAKDIANTDSRIKISRNNKNIGPFAVRRLGVNTASGKYVVFADADDWYESDAIRRMYEVAIKYDVDMVQIRYQRRMKGMVIKRFEKFNPELADRRIEGDELKQIAAYIGMGSDINPACWGKLYRRKLLDSIDPIEFPGFWGDDQILNIHYMRHARSMTFIDYLGYNYRWGGETSFYRYSRLHDFKQIHLLKLELGQDKARTNAEFTDLLRYHIRQMLTELGWTPEAIIYSLEKEFKDPVWNDATFGKDAATIVAEEAAAIKNRPMKYFAKKMLR